MSVMHTSESFLSIPLLYFSTFGLTSWDTTPKPNGNTSDKADYSDILAELDQNLGGSLQESLQTIVLCDRFNKNEKATKGLDFTLVRNLLNTYNQKHLQAYLEVKANCFLTAFYLRKACGVKSSKSLKSLESECTKQTDVNPNKLRKQMEYLYEICCEALPQAVIVQLDSMAAEK